jgi:hypothetical protein
VIGEFELSEVGSSRTEKSGVLETATSKLTAGSSNVPIWPISAICDVAHPTQHQSFQVVDWFIPVFPECPC